MVVTRAPLTTIGMNSASAAPKRRSARLSAEGQEENEPPSKKAKVNAAQNAEAPPAEGGIKKRARKVYEHAVDDFTFSKSKRTRAAKEPAVRNSRADKPSPAAHDVAAAGPVAVSKKAQEPSIEPEPAAPATVAEVAPKTRQRKNVRQFPTTPERTAATKTVRKSKRLSDEHVSSSPSRPAHAKSHAKQDRSPSPIFRPVTVDKKRRRQAGGAEEEEKTMRIALPFADTPVIKRNKEMRKASADTSRRSSSGMRGKRASSLIDEGRGNGESTSHTDDERHSPADRAVEMDEETGDAGTGMLTDRSTTALPHTEVPTAEFYKHIGADLTEPRRMRCLLGWCGSRALPAKPEAPKNNTKEANDEFQALQAGKFVAERALL
jgi:kinetochore protein Mis13/DSN1